MMQRQLLEDLHKYFSNIKKPTKDEKSLLLRLTGELPYFYITSVHRDDLEDAKMDVSHVTDGQMETIARKMADDYLEQMYWISLPIIAEYAGVPKQFNS
jgi:lipoate synthase